MLAQIPTDPLAPVVMQLSCDQPMASVSTAPARVLANDPVKVPKISNVSAAAGGMAASTQSRESMKEAK